MSSKKGKRGGVEERLIEAALRASDAHKAMQMCYWFEALDELHDAARAYRRAKGLK